MFENEMIKLKKLYEDGLFQKPFYNERVAGDSSFSSYEEFRKIPFMYKDDIRKTGVFERTATRPEDIYGIFSSSGTTGEKTYYIYSKKDKIVHEEFVNTFYSELEIEAADLGGVFAPVDTGVMAHTMMWQFTTRGAGYVNCPLPSPDEMIKLIQEVPVTVVATRPSSLCTIANNPKFVKIAQNSSVKKLLMGGGFVSEERRKLIEKIWDADAYNMFGMSEMFGPMAGECRQKNGLHYLDKYLMIEILDPVTLEPVKPGEIGMAVYTTLWDKGFPLLRYWTDDLMVIENKPCKCGSDLPRLRHKGRMADSLYVGGKYVFPETLENCLIKNGFIGEYRANEQENGTILVTIEASEATVIPKEMKQEMDDIFKSTVEVKKVPLGSLEYDGHQPRFTSYKSLMER